MTDRRKESLFNLVDTDGSGSIDAQEFAVLYDAIKKDLAEELEKEAELQKETLRALASQIQNGEAILHNGQAVRRHPGASSMPSSLSQSTSTARHG